MEKEIQLKMKKFIEERDNAILSLDRDKIIAYSNKYKIKMPKEDLVFWCGVHKAVLGIKSATPEQKENSMKWLKEHNFHGLPFDLQ